jgi:hypothetical protein
MHLVHIKRLAHGARDLEAREVATIPSTATAPVREDIGRLVEDYVRQKLETLQRNPASALPPIPAFSNINRPSSVQKITEAAGQTITSRVSNDLPIAEFVCEDDVRRALAANSKIRIGPKTLLTPSARELGESKGVFIAS